MIIFLYILSIVTSILFGVLEGLLFCGMAGGKHISEFWQKKTKTNIHILLNIIRVFVFSGFVISTYLISDILFTSVFSLSLISMFSFWHNGFYYLTRSKLDGAYYGFMDQSETTTAKISLSFHERLVSFGLSIFLITVISI